MDEPPDDVSRPTVIGDGSDLEREVAEELRLAQASHPDEVMREPIADWRYDPTEAERYEVLLHDLLDAVEVVEDGSSPHDNDRK